MPFDPQTSVSDPRFGYEFAYILNELYPSNNVVTANRLVTSALGEETIAQPYAINDLAPAFCIFKGSTVTVVAMDGIRTADQVAALVLSWIEDRTNRTWAGFVRSADRVSDTVYDRLSAFEALANNRVILTGHSYGGMCLMSLAGRLARDRRARLVSLATFGSPKAGDDRMAAGLAQVDLCRYMNFGDYIPHCPPIGSQAPLMHLLMSRGEKENVDYLVQVGDRNPILAVDGTITLGGYPQDGAMFTDLSIANFLVSNSAPVSIAHRISEYVRRLSIWVRNNPEVPIRARGAANAVGVVEPIAEPAAPIGDGSGTRRGGNGGAGQVNVNEIPQILAGIAGQPLPVNPQQAMGPPAPTPVGNQPVTAYKTRKIGRVWVVYYIDPERIVMIGTGKQHAKRFASRMNSALNGWNGAAATDEGAFEQSAIDAFN